MWNHLAHAFGREFGGECAVERERYHFYSRSLMRAFRDRIVAKHDTGVPLILCGHSAGGAIAFDVANRLQKSTVMGIVTIFSPLSFPIDFLTMLNVVLPKVPIVSFGARHDFIVPHPFTSHRNAIAHRLLPTDHQEGLISDPRVANIIARYSARYLRPDSG
jgi:pimeloyl-ACP methyl ester carboxylesterase